MIDPPLRAVQTNQGATLTDQQTMPIDFGDAADEYSSARNATALFDLSDRTQIELAGEDRSTFLHNFCTNDIKSLEPGQGCEAFITSVKAHVLAHVFVFAGDDALGIDTTADAEDSLIAHLDRYIITEDVVLHRKTEQQADLFVSGPQAAASLESLGIAAAALAPVSQMPGVLFGKSVTVRRVDLLGSPGFLLSVPRAELAAVWTGLTESGIRPAGSASFDALRIEAGMPLYGVDISEENLAPEVGRTSQAISFTKGCYLGQEPIARIDSMGHVNRELRGLRLSAGPVPAVGTQVLSADEASEPIGRITSAACSYADNIPVALAYLRRTHIAPGTEVLVQTERAAIPATVYGNI